MARQQLTLDFSKPLFQWKKGETKAAAQRIVSATIQRIKKENDLDKKWRYKIIKREFSKLVDEL